MIQKDITKSTESSNPSISDFRLREFREDDLQPVLNLIHKTIDVCYPAVYPQEVVEFFKDHHSIEHVLADASEGYTIVLESEGVVTGTGTLFQTNIRRVFIDPSRQKRGTGKIVMKELERQACASAIPIVDLEASLFSIQFYKSLGYNDLGERFITVKNDRKLFYRQMNKDLISKQESNHD